MRRIKLGKTFYAFLDFLTGKKFCSTDFEHEVDNEVYNNPF